MKKLLGLLFASLVVFAVIAPIRAQESANKPAKETRWEGTVMRISSDKSSFDVRQVNGAVEKTIYFDSATVSRGAGGLSRTTRRNS
jgi:hypothetical protein